MFNLRIYGLLIHENKILVCEEPVRGNSVVKFPGGGLEFGEGIIDGLKREFREELGAEISNIRHFYTTDFFVQSFINPNHQVISIYYLIDADIATLNFSKDPELHFFWVEMSQLNSDMFPLPIDKYVVDLLIHEFQL